MIATILLLLGIIFLHELGHWLAARIWRFRTPVLSVGIGPRLFHFRWADTEWRLCLLPLGGYVELPELSRQYRVSFQFSQPSLPVVEYVAAANGRRVATPFQRIVIAAAGPFVNLLLAVAFVALLVMSSVPIPAALSSSEVGFPIPGALEYEKRGDELRAGDQILMGESPNASSATATISTLYLPGGTMRRLSVLAPPADADAEAKVRTLSVRLSPAFRAGELVPLPVIPQEPIVIQAVVTDGADSGNISIAAAARLRPGDAWRKLDGLHLSCPAELAWRLREAAGREVTAELERDGKVVTQNFNVPPRPSKRAQLPAWLGFTVKTEHEGANLIYVRHLSVAAQIAGMEEALAGVAPAGERDAGMLGLVDFVSERMEREGVAGLVMVAAILNLVVLIFNLLPIPPLDGGRIAEGGLELIIRRPFPAFLTLWKDAFSTGFILTLLLGVLLTDLTSAGSAAIRQVQSQPPPAGKSPRGDEPSPAPGPAADRRDTNAAEASAPPTNAAAGDVAAAPPGATEPGATASPTAPPLPEATRRLRTTLRWLRAAENAMRGETAAADTTNPATTTETGGAP
ncbi:hypothetical protein DB346_25050 [Verrucomicrobia bacterium LW23]|nr:hypothetical protein DB346_25050 [Verrucomicrobia bacterium LW23]